jgi:hypothetical protein
MNTQIRTLALLALLAVMAAASAALAEPPLTAITKFGGGKIDPTIHAPAQVPDWMVDDLEWADTMPALTVADLSVSWDGDTGPDETSRVEFVIAVENTTARPIKVQRIENLLEDDHWIVPDIGDVILEPREVLLIKVVFAPQAAGEYKGLFDVGYLYRSGYRLVRVRTPGVARVTTQESRRPRE